jgi:hypothetical protein
MAAGRDKQLGREIVPRIGEAITVIGNSEGAMGATTSQKLVSASISATNTGFASTANRI